PGCDAVLTGAELDRLSERQRLDQVPRTTVFARVSPEHKVRIVQAMQQAGHVVAMTGDGVNDAAAIRLADVGIGVAGKSSTAAGPVTLSGADLARTLTIRGGATALAASGAWYAGRVTGRPRRADTMGLAALVATQLGQTLLTGRRSPPVLVTCAVSAAVLIGIVETPGISQFFGCTPLGPLAWGIVAASSAAGTAAAAAPRASPATA